MITVQAVLLVALGFLAASLIALLLAPAFWRRAVRLTSRRIREQLPVNEREVAAEKDRLRAEHAMDVHRLELQLDRTRRASAQRLIELNRREAALGQASSEVERLRQANEETQNARRVLEQTVADRLPRVEARLTEAKQLLAARDRDIMELTRTAQTQTRALAEAGAINVQHQSEIERLLAALATRGARPSDGPSDPRFDGELALRSEVEALRAKTREQASLVARMQSQLAGRPTLPPLSEAAGAADAAALAGVNRRPSGDAAAASAEAIVRGQAAHAELEAQLRALRARNEDQAGEIARLRAALAVFESGEGEAATGLRDSRIALRAKLGSVEALAAEQADTIRSLRAELAATNERLARQASHFMGELKRLGAGTLPASPQARRPAVAASRITLAERVAQARAQGEPQPAAAPAPAPAVENGEAPLAASAALVDAVQPAPPAPEEEAAAPSRGKLRLLDRMASITKSPQS